MGFTRTDADIERPLAGISADRFQAKAFFLGERIDLRSYHLNDRLASAPLTISAGKRGLAMLFRYGVVVLFDCDPTEEAALLWKLGPRVMQPYARPEVEEVTIRIDPERKEGIEGGVISLRDAEVIRLQLVAVILSKSVVLAQFESSIAQNFDRIEPLAENLERMARGGRPFRELLRHIGTVLLIEHKMVGRVEVRERPELIWKHADLESLYHRLEEEYELRDRFAALDHKLTLTSRTVGTVVELLENRRILRVEWYIVLLIVMEILLSCYELFWRG